jgi:Uma2 family endonuclease
VLSPSTAYHDQTAKLAAYERGGVHEVWLVNADRETVLVYTLDTARGRYGERPLERRRGETLASTSVPAAQIELETIFGH